MSMVDAVRNITIDDAAIEGIVADYFAELDKQRPGLGDLMQLRARTDVEFMQDCKRAASDALVLSTLAATMNDDNDFGALVAVTYVFDEEFFEHMRADLFDVGLSTVRETTQPNDDLWHGIENRALLFRQAKGLPTSDRTREQGQAVA